MVTAAFRARARPVRVVPGLTVMLEKAITFPENDPASVAELLTCQ